MQAMSGYAACRTKWFDEFFIAAGAGGIEQAVILAAGLDARAWRLPWDAGSVVYEIDQPKVLEFKTETLRANDAKPATKLCRRVRSTCARTGQRRCEKRDSSPPSLPPGRPRDCCSIYPPTAQDLSVRAHRRTSAPRAVASRSRHSIPSFFDPERLDQRRARMQQMREAAARAGHEMADPEELWFPEERADVADWLGEHGWQVTAIEARELMTRYHREAADDIEEATPPSIFVDGQLAD